MNTTEQEPIIDYLDVHQHWCAVTEAYGGGDCLATFMSQGWELGQTIYLEYKQFGGNRRTTIYHCRLLRDRQVLDIPVIENPYVRRLIWQRRLVQFDWEAARELVPVSIA